MYQLEKFGSFYIGGREVEISGQSARVVQRNPQVSMIVDPNGKYSIESLYVQYFLPINYQTSYVLIHGGGHTGTVWDITPDGRDGWLQLLLKQGNAVYVIDSVERGRAGWCSLPNIWLELPEQKSHQTVWNGFRLGSVENFAAKEPYIGQQFPVEFFEELAKYDVPRWNSHADKSAEALSKLLKKIGKCSLIAHSQGADIALKCFNLTPQLIENIILLEPAAFPEIKVTSQSAKFLILWGDYIELSPLWSSVKKMSFAYLKKLQKLELSGKIISLPEKNIFGNSHMLMMDKNNADLLNLVLRWQKN